MPMVMSETKTIEIIHEGKKLEGACSFDTETMVVVAKFPYSTVSTSFVFPDGSFSEEYADNKAKELLIELYEDYERILAYQDEIRAVLPEFYRQREKWKGTRDESSKSNALFGKMLHEIIGKRCCFEALEAKVTGVLEELDANKKLFDNLVEQGVEMPLYQAMRLLAKLALDKNKNNIGQSTVAYHSGGQWLKEYVKIDHPLANRFRKMSFFEVMIFLCPEYDAEVFDSFDLVPVDDDMVFEYTYQLMRKVDSDTAKALCRGVWLGFL
jgi:hypothetical protein